MEKIKDCFPVYFLCPFPFFTFLICNLCVGVGIIVGVGVDVIVCVGVGVIVGVGDGIT